MSATETSLFLFLFLGLALYSCGAPSGRQLPTCPKARLSDLFLNMVYICDDDPKLVQVVSRTKMAYAKKHFGDAAESREVTVKGMELLDNYRTMPLHTFVSKAYKQLSIFDSIFKDIKLQWSRSQEEKKHLVKKLEVIVSSIGKLKSFLTSAALLCRQPVSEVKQFNTGAIWTKSALQQKTWILGVLSKFERSMLYLQPAFKMYFKQFNEL